MRKRKYERFTPIIENMPALSAWPDRSIPYSDLNNQIIHWISETCDVGFVKAGKIWQNIMCKKVVVFNPETKLWTGRCWGGNGPS